MQKKTLYVSYTRLTKYGPRMFWKKHKLQDMPMGYGGCYVIQPLLNNTYRIHTFGGRELGIDLRGFDLGWTQNPNLLVKFPRNVDIFLNDSNNLNVMGNDSVTRLKCKLPLTPEDIANFTNPYITQWARKF